MIPPRPEDWRDRLLSPRQSALFLMETARPLEAWRSCMRLLRTIEAPRHPDSPHGPDVAEASALAKTLWKVSICKPSRTKALKVMDQILAGRPPGLASRL